MSALTDTARLVNDVEVPLLGFGTWQVPDGEATYDAVTAALAAGYRHIDTARAYGNEASVGRALRDSGVPREDVFLTTKLPAEVKDYVTAVTCFEESLEKLGVDVLDLWLIHAPWPWDAIGTDHAAGNAEVWRAFEEFYAAGRVRSIGVSNFSATDIDSLVAVSTVTPQVNQVRLHVGHNQAELSRYCAEHGIVVEAYSPLATGRILDDPRLAEIAKEVGRTVAQVCIRYTLQRGAVSLPKTTTPSRMTENADVDFTLSDAHMAALDAITED